MRRSHIRHLLYHSSLPQSSSEHTSDASSEMLPPDYTQAVLAFQTSFSAGCLSIRISSPQPLEPFQLLELQQQVQDLGLASPHFSKRSHIQLHIPLTIDPHPRHPSPHIFLRSLCVKQEKSCSSFKVSCTSFCRSHFGLSLLGSAET